MSFKLTALALDFGPDDMASRMIFLSLCDRADANTGECWPSYADIAERSRCSRSTVMRRLRLLRRQGWIATRQRSNQTLVIRLNVQRLRDAEAERASRVSAGVPDGFEPFPEERAAVERARLQAIENKAEGQPDTPEGHSDTPEGHVDPLTCQKPINNLSAENLSDFEVSQVQRGATFVKQGRLVHGLELARLLAELEARA